MSGRRSGSLPYKVTESNAVESRFAGMPSASRWKRRGGPRPSYRGELPPGHDSLGLLLLGVTGDQVLPADVYTQIATTALSTVRGTVQADILKEDQAQNTCIFSTEFALRMMGDLQQDFVDHKVRNF